MSNANACLCRAYKETTISHFNNQVEFVLKYILEISHFTKYSYNLHGVWWRL